MSWMDGLFVLVVLILIGVWSLRRLRRRVLERGAPMQSTDTLLPTGILFVNNRVNPAALVVFDTSGAMHTTHGVYAGDGIYEFVLPDAVFVAR